MSAPTKKRRVELVQVAPAGGEASLQLSSFAPTLSLADGVTVTLSSTPPAKTETVANAESLAAVLKRRAEVARQTHDRWVRSPRAAWIQSLLAELGPPAREELLALQRRHTTLAAEDFATRWELGAEWSGRVVALWLGAEGRSVDEVIAKAAEFGHEKEELSSGVVLEGGLLHSLATGADVGVEELLPWVKALTAAAAGSAGGAATEEVSASLYRVDPSNHFLTAADTSAPLDSLGDEVRLRIASGRGVGSLNTTFDFASGESGSGVPLLDGYWERLDDATYVVGEGVARLNPRLYLIWKTAGYCTPYHQDVHVPPHFTLYNQTSGASAFHFLPLLLGEYATLVGRRDGPSRLKELLQRLDREGVGEVATLGPKQMLLILPGGAHGVYVPRPALQLPPPARPLPPFRLSVIRAAELFVAPVCDLYERLLLSAADWATPLGLSEREAQAEAATLDAFAAVQQRACAELGLSRSDWTFFATLLQRRWDAAAEAAGLEGANRETTIPL